MLPQYFLVKVVKADAGLLRNLDKTVFKQRVWNTGHRIGPPWHVDRVELKGQNVVHSGRCMYRCQTGNRAFGHMHGNRHAVFVGNITDLFQFQRTAAGQNIRVNDRHPACLDELFKIFLEIDILACTNREQELFFSRTYWSVYIHGTMSSIQARL